MRTVAIATALLATGAIAAPNTAARWARHAAPATRKRVEFSTVWAGAVVTDTGFTSVSATVKLPVPKTEITSASAAAWVGIDGDTCNHAILQTGVDFSVDGSGQVSYDAWYEWWPSLAFDFTDFALTGGDEIRMNVTADSALTSGVATLENLSTGDSVTHTFSSSSTVQLCGFDAEWIVEDYEEGFGQVALDDFDSVTFTDAAAIKSGEAVGVTNATIFDIQQNGVTLTDCGVTDSSTVFCNYVSQ
ncbi:peptidase A4 family-domain-containing protein [Xylaria intraflava]|nr:peptidase A4 family-domain-containing protein [Xylaria intraflava]